MKKQTQYIVVYALAAVVLFSLVGINEARAQVSVIVSSSSPNAVSKEEAKSIFSGVTAAWPSGAKIQVIDQAETETGKTFYDKFVGKAASQVRLQWTKLVLSGQAAAPKKVNDDESVKKAVASDPNSIGFIKSSALDGSVKEIARVQ